MKYVLLLLGCLLLLKVGDAQMGGEQYANYYNAREQYWEGVDYISLVDSASLHRVKLSRKYENKQVKTLFLVLNEGDLKQLNITGCYYCSVKHEDMYELWNLWYPKVGEDDFKILCKGLVAIMKMDGLLSNR